MDEPGKSTTASQALPAMADGEIHDDLDDIYDSPKPDSSLHETTSQQATNSVKSQGTREGKPQGQLPGLGSWSESAGKGSNDSTTTVKIPGDAPVDVANDDGSRLKHESGDAPQNQTNELREGATLQEGSMIRDVLSGGPQPSENDQQIPKDAPTQGPVGEADASEIAFKEIAEANKSDPQAEFEMDSSPYQSSDSDSDSDSSSDSSSGRDGEKDDYKLLSPEEQARRLMAEDGGSDDEGAVKSGKIGVGLRTANEKSEVVVPKPDITITEDTAIDELGAVEHVVENLVLVKAKTTGEFRVLESGSVLCRPDKEIIGVVAETLGRVEQPYYSVQFTSAAAVEELGLVRGSPVSYIPPHSTHIFTQSLRNLKGSDASNIHDEEVGDDELEFSDDEAEAEHKRRLKLQRQAKREGRELDLDSLPNARQSTGGRGRGRASRAMRQSRGGHAQFPTPSHATPTLNYDDDSKSDAPAEDIYTPLQRPAGLYPGAGAATLARFTPRGRGRGHQRGSGRGASRGSTHGHHQHGAFPPASQAYPHIHSVSPPVDSSTQYQQSSYAGFQAPPPIATVNGYVQAPPPPLWAGAAGQQMQQLPISPPPLPPTAFPHPQGAPYVPPLPPSILPGAHVNPAFYAAAGQPGVPPGWAPAQPQASYSYSPDNASNGNGPAQAWTNGQDDGDEYRP